MIVSYSEVYKWQTCQRQYMYRFIKGLAPVEESGPITLGVNGHKLLEMFYTYLREGLTKDQAWTATKDSAVKQVTFDRNFLVAWTLVDNYIRDTKFSSEVELIENRFLLPVAMLSNDPDLSDVQIGFTPDLVIRRPGSFLDVEDFKFVGREWAQKKKNRFPQTKLYQIFLNEMGYNVTRSLVRFFNTTTGKMSITPYTLTATEAQILTRDFIKGVKEVINFRIASAEDKEEAPRTMVYSVCQYCQFEFPCGLESEGKDASKTFKNLYVKSTYDYNS